MTVPNRTEDMCNFDQVEFFEEILQILEDERR